ncbi:MAG TPA: hypothetical protein K8V15_00600 [Tessaracoccus flavescens]|uniref:Uncharacterized protein n=1 Tax=Tessaracoccus flavescens TaxID=399497 RepID=A0A921JPY0_9ACTN|nr:hypothetical protein [Tessaracoccus flavescens]
MSTSEKTPDAITGTAWGDIVIDNVNFTVAAGDTTDIVVTNPFNDVPTPSPSRPPVKPGPPAIRARFSFSGRSPRGMIDLPRSEEHHGKDKPRLLRG